MAQDGRAVGLSLEEPIQVRVVLVDDNALVRLTLDRALRRHGFSVRMANSTAQARALVTAEIPDVLLSDLTMGGARPADDSELGADGFWLLAWARSAYPALPLVLISGQDPPPGFIDLARGGMARFLPKPFSVEALLDTIGIAMARARSI
jgi:CheY-like chemotaxis protein